MTFCSNIKVLDYNSDTDNCVGCMTFCTQLSVCKTAKASHLPNAVFHIIVWFQKTG